MTRDHAREIQNGLRAYTDKGLISVEPSNDNPQDYVVYIDHKEVWIKCYLRSYEAAKSIANGIVQELRSKGLLKKFGS